MDRSSPDYISSPDNEKKLSGFECLSAENTFAVVNYLYFNTLLAIIIHIVHIPALLLYVIINNYVHIWRHTRCNHHFTILKKASLFLFWDWTLWGRLPLLHRGLLAWQRLWSSIKVWLYWASGSMEAWMCKFPSVEEIITDRLTDRRRQTDMVISKLHFEKQEYSQLY